MDNISKMCWEDLSDELAKQLGYTAQYGRGRVNIKYIEDAGEIYDMGEGWQIVAPWHDPMDIREVFSTEEEAWEDAPNLLSIYEIERLPWDDLHHAGDGYIATTDQASVFHLQLMRAIAESVYRAKLGQKGTFGLKEEVWCTQAGEYQRCNHCPRKEQK